MIGIEPELLADKGVERRLGIAEDPVGNERRLFLGEALGAVDARQLCLLLFGQGLQFGALQRDLPLVQLPLRLHRDVLAGGHAECPGEETGDAGEQDSRGSLDAPATPMTRDRLLTRPSLTPKMTARRVPD